MSNYLKRLEHWHQETSNPLYAWEAIALHMRLGLPIPDWAAAYLKQAAENMTMLGWRRDFRKDGGPDIDGKAALALVGQALLLTEERKKNAFDRRADDGRASRAALDDNLHGRVRARKELIRGERSNDRADKIIRRGHKLNKLP